jgi:peptidoglycan/xylan/chitin deacetylase (PgdA/CDA1 family)
MIAGIVTVVTFVAAATAGLVSLLAGWTTNVDRLFLIVAGLLVFILTEAVLLFAVFERRAPVFGRIVWRGSAHERHIALTFDDGPNEPFTGRILDILARLGVTAAFFVIGENAERFPDVLHRANAEGHEIGNHTYGHDVLPLKSTRFIQNEITRTSDIIESITGKRPTLFRAPHGWRNPWLGRAARRAGVEPIAWSLGVWDTDRPGAEAIVRRTMKGLRNGCILLLHDGRGVERDADSSQLVDALPRIIDGARNAGFRFVPLSTLIKESARA